jgi:hypothetical protein
MMTAPPTSTEPAPPARELWSHEFLDALALEQCRETARRIEADPALLNVARENIRRWLARTGYDAAEIRALAEWQALLDAGDLRPVLTALTHPGENAVRLRQSSPFAGILSTSDRERIMDKVAQLWTHDEPR